MPSNVQWVFSTISQTVGAVWALLVLFMWKVLTDIPPSKRLSAVFAVLNALAASSIVVSILGLFLDETGSTLMYPLAVLLALAFIAVVGLYYMLLALIMYEQAGR